MDDTAWKIAIIVITAALALLLSVRRFGDKSGRLVPAVLVVLTLLGLGLASVEPPASGSCEDVAGQAGAGAEDDAAGQEAGAPVPLEVAPDSDLAVEFRQRRDARRVSVFLQRVRGKTEPRSAEGQSAGQDQEASEPSLPEPGTPLNVLAVDFERDGGDFQLDPEHIQAGAVVRTNRDGVRLTLCIDPEKVPAGRYQGSVVFDDTRVTAGSVQWTITLQYARWWLAAFGALLIAMAAFFYSYATTNTEQRIKDYARDNFIGIAAGLATATVAFIGAYWDSTDWGGKPNDWLKGAGVVFAAFTTGFLAQRISSPKHGGVAQNGDGGAAVGGTPTPRGSSPTGAEAPGGDAGGEAIAQPGAAPAAIATQSPPAAPTRPSSGGA